MTARPGTSWPRDDSCEDSSATRQGCSWCRSSSETGSGRAGTTLEPSCRKILRPALPQLLERAGDVHARHLLAPAQLEIGVVHRLRGTVRGLCRGCDTLVR